MKLDCKCSVQYRSLKSLNEIVHGIIQTRRRQPRAHDDLLSMLLLACEEGTGRGMSDKQLRDEVMTVFVAGHETTANAMAWLLYLVSQHPDVEEKLLAEIDAHWLETGLTNESLGAFAYARQVIEESLRLSNHLVGRPPLHGGGRIGRLPDPGWHERRCSHFPFSLERTFLGRGAEV